MCLTGKTPPHRLRRSHPRRPLGHDQPAHPAGARAVERACGGGCPARVATPQAADLEQAIGQYILYEDILAQTNPQRRVVLAIPQLAWDTVFVRDIGKLALQNRLHFVFVFEPEREVITQWVL